MGQRPFSTSWTWKPLTAWFMMAPECDHIKIMQCCYSRCSSQRAKWVWTAFFQTSMVIKRNESPYIILTSKLQRSFTWHINCMAGSSLHPKWLSFFPLGVLFMHSQLTCQIKWIRIRLEMGLKAFFFSKKNGCCLKQVHWFCIFSQKNVVQTRIDMYF